MKIEVNINKWRFYTLLGVFMVIGAALIVNAQFGTTAFDSGKPWHPIQQIATDGSGTANLDGNGDGKIDAEYLASRSYVGATAGTFDGAEVGGYDGGNSKCSALFSGSRMCTAADFANGRPDTTGWISAFVSASDGTRSSNDCSGFLISLNNVYGQVLNPGGPAIASCDLPQKILCCG
jgi:hypothetical protein